MQHLLSNPMLGLNIIEQIYHPIIEQIIYNGEPSPNRVTLNCIKCVALQVMWSCLQSLHAFVIKPFSPTI